MLSSKPTQPRGDFGRRHGASLLAVCLLAVIGALRALPLWAASYVEPTKLANRLFPTNTSSTYAAGSSVAMSGDVLVVGDPVAGAAYVFNRNAGGVDNWGQVKTLLPDSPPKIGFGTAVACDGASIVVGSPTERAAYVFSGSGSSWTKNDKIRLDYQPTFGAAVAVAGNFVVVGAPNGYTYSGAGLEGNSGAAYLFDRNASSPNPQVGGEGSGWGVVVNPGPTLGYGYPEGNLFSGGVTLFNASGNHFGTSVAVNGQYVAVGSPDAEPGANPNYGLVSVYYIKNSQGSNIWEYGYPMDPAVAKISGGKFGQSLALRGNRLLIGQPEANAVYTFDLKTVPFGERVPLKARLLSPDGLSEGGFGSALAFDGTSIAVTAPNYFLLPPYAPTAPGAVYIFDSAGSLQKKLVYGGCETNPQFAASVAISGGLVAVGVTNKLPNTTRGSVSLSEGTSGDVVVSWSAPNGGPYGNALNWSAAKVPAKCDVVRLASASPSVKSIDMTAQPPFAASAYEAASLQVTSGSWALDLAAGGFLRRSFHLSSTATVSSDAALVVNQASLDIPQFIVQANGRLDLSACNLASDTIEIGSGASATFSDININVGNLNIDANGSLIVNDGLVQTSNLNIQSECILGWKNASIVVNDNLIFDENTVLNVEIDPTQTGSETPLFKVGSNYYFHAGGRLNFIPTSVPLLAPGQRFRLVEFNARTDDVQTIYEQFRFTNYVAEINDDLIWGLAFRRDSTTGKEFVEVLVMKKPQRIVGGALTPSGSRPKLVLGTHGTYSEIGGANDGAFGEIVAGIRTFVINKSGPGNSKWDFATYDWQEYSTKLKDFTYNAATSAQIGIGLAESIHHWLVQSGFNYTDMHLLSHSSGSWLINRLSELSRPTAKVHLTFFDAFVNPAKDLSFWNIFDGRFNATLGAKSDFAEQYVDKATLPPGTGEDLPDAVNFDVTYARISSYPFGSPSTFCPSLPPLRQACLTLGLVDSHAWPYKWYLETVRRANTNANFSMNGFYCGGFILSPEFLETAQGEPEFQFVSGYKASLQDKIPAANSIIGIYGCGGLLPFQSASDLYPGQFNSIATAPVGTYTSTIGGGVDMLTGASTSAGPIPGGNGGNDPQPGPVPGAQWAAITNYVALPHAAREFSFDYQFSGSSTGLLSVFVDGGFIGALDQSVVGTNLMSSGSLQLNPELLAGLHNFVFLLESSSDQQAGVSLSNLKIGYDSRSIIVEEELLGLGTNRLTLQGIPQRVYTIECALNVFGPWTNIGTVVIGTNGLCGFTNTQSATATVFYRAYAAAPSISTPTQYLTNIVGNNLTLSASVQGTPPLYYQWFQNGVIIAGATNSSFSISSLTTNASGVYSIIVSNSHGAVESQIANLTVLVPPSITVQPLSWTKLIGENISLNITANGTPPLTYRWRKNGAPLSDGGNIFGSGTTLLTITNLQISDQARYDIEVSNGGGTVTSELSSLIVMPLSQTAVITGVTATATSELTTYGRVASNVVNGIYFDTSFWESVGYDQGFGRDAAPAITFDLKRPFPLDNFEIWNGHEPGRAIKRLRPEVSMDGTNFISLNEVSLAVTTGALMSETNKLGGVWTRFVRFTVLEGWNGVDYPTGDPNPASALVAIDEVEFHLIKTNQNPPSITVHPPNQILQTGQVMFLGIAATGTDPLSYQWRRGGAPILDGTNFSGTKTPLLVITNAQLSDLGNYDVVVTNYFGSVTSHVAKLSLPLPVDSLLVTGVTATATSELPSNFNRPPINMVNNAVNPGGFWESIGVNQGFGEDRAPIIIFDLGKVLFLDKLVFLNGPEYPASVKRMRAEVSTDGQNFLPAGEINLALGSSPPTPQTNIFGIETRFIRFHILENWDGQIFPVVGPRTANSFAEIDEVFFYAYAVPSGPPLITDQPVHLIRIVGATADFTVTALGSEPLAYQWKRNGTNLAQGGNLSGTTSATLTLTNVQFSDAAEYQAVITNAFGATNSIVARLTVIPGSGVLLLRPALVGSSMTFHLLGMPGTTWEIQRAPTLIGPWTGIGTVSIGSDADALFSDSTPLKPTSFYRAAEAQMVAPSISVQPLNITNLAGSFASFGVTASGTMPIAYQWRFLGTNIVAATNALLQITNVQFSQAGDYDVVVTNLAGTTNSTVAILTVVGPPLITAQPQSRTNLAGTMASLNVTVTGTAPLIYGWLKGDSGLSDGGNVSGATTPMLSLTNVQSADAAAYRLVITNSYGSVTSVVATISVMSNLNSILITGITATASSELAAFGRIAANAVNGIYYDSAFWESVGVNQGFGEDRNPAITFDLLTLRSLDKFIIWNGHEPPASVKRMLVKTSVDGTNFNSLGELPLTNISPASQTNTLNGVSARYVRFEILENGAGQIFPAIGSATAWSLVAIDEVEFHAYTGN